MIWKVLGMVRNPIFGQKFASSHSMGPTPIQISEDVIRVYFTCLDENGIGRPAFVDVSSENPTRVLGVSDRPLLDVGLRGTFDDNGIMVTSVIRLSDSRYFMYYSGFELCEKIRYRILSGVAISSDGGNTFSRFSSTPILERSDDELFFRGGPYVMEDEGIFKMWYVAGSEWLDIEGKQMPVYELKFLESGDGLNWGKTGKIVLSISKEDEHGFGRPWILKNEDGCYELFYSIRRKSLSSYRLGYANSLNGTTWTRKDEEMNLDVEQNSPYSNAIMYSAVININERTFCFFNGNEFGKEGFLVSERIL